MMNYNLLDWIKEPSIDSTCVQEKLCDLEEVF